MMTHFVLNQKFSHKQKRKHDKSAHNKTFWNKTTKKKLLDFIPDEANATCWKACFHFPTHAVGVANPAHTQYHQLGQYRFHKHFKSNVCLQQGFSVRVIFVPSAFAAEAPQCRLVSWASWSSHGSSCAWCSWADTLFLFSVFGPAGIAREVAWTLLNPQLVKTGAHI